MVEEILDSAEIPDKRHRNGKRFEYFVKWQGYSNEENSWQPAANLKNAETLVQEFHRKFPTKPRSPLFQDRRSRVFARSLFPTNFFDRIATMPTLTTGIDQELPDEITCARLARQAVRI
jgi:hypothetical protein